MTITGGREGRIHEYALETTLLRLRTAGWRTWRVNERGFAAYVATTTTLKPVRLDSPRGKSAADDFDGYYDVQVPIESKREHKTWAKASMNALEKFLSTIGSARAIQIARLNDAGNYSCRVPDGIAFRNGRVAAVEVFSSASSMYEKSDAYGQFDEIWCCRYRAAQVFAALAPPTLNVRVFYPHLQDPFIAPPEPKKGLPTGDDTA